MPPQIQGEFVSAEAVEQRLGALPGVAEAAVRLWPARGGTGADGRPGGEPCVVAYVVLREEGGAAGVNGVHRPG